MKQTQSIRKPVHFFDAFSGAITRASGKPVTFICAFIIIVVWALTGPIFNYSDTWQLVINTSTTVITFLMVFVIQQTQNKDTMALHLKLNELIASDRKASNRLIDIEDLNEEELQTIKAFYVSLSQLSQSETNIHATHSLDEAKELHKMKRSEITQ